MTGGTTPQSTSAKSSAVKNVGLNSEPWRRPNNGDVGEKGDSFDISRIGYWGQPVCGEVNSLSGWLEGRLAISRGKSGASSHADAAVFSISCCM